MTSMENNRAVGFGVYTGAATKGTVVDNTALQTSGFGVFGFYTEKAIFSDASTPNFMYNTQVSYVVDASDSSKGSWSYSPMKYWSEDKDDLYTFLAYAPYSSDNLVSVTDNSAKPVVTVSFPSTDSAAGMIDFVADGMVNITSGTDESVTNSAGDDADEVKFVMQHEMTRVAIQAKSDVTGTSNGEDATQIVVKSVEFGGANFYTSGDYSFATTADTRGSWDFSTKTAASYDCSDIINKDNVEVEAYAAAQGKTVANDNSAISLFEPDEYLFLFPVAGTTGISTEKVTITVTYDIVTTDDDLAAGYTASIDNIKTVTLPSGLAQGVAYIYTLTFSMNEVKLSATVDAGWGTEVPESATDGTESGFDAVSGSEA